MKPLSPIVKKAVTAAIILSAVIFLGLNARHELAKPELLKAIYIAPLVDGNMVDGIHFSQTTEQFRAEVEKQYPVGFSETRLIEDLSHQKFKIEAVNCPKHAIYEQDPSLMPETIKGAGAARTMYRFEIFWCDDGQGAIKDVNTKVVVSFQKRKKG